MTAAQGSRSSTTNSYRCPLDYTHTVSSASFYTPFGSAVSNADLQADEVAIVPFAPTQVHVSCTVADRPLIGLGADAGLRHWSKASGKSGTVNLASLDIFFEQFVANNELSYKTTIILETIRVRLMEVEPENKLAPWIRAHVASIDR